MSFAKDLACMMLEVDEQDLSRRLVKMIERTEELVEKTGGVVRSRQVVATLIAVDETGLRIEGL